MTDQNGPIVIAGAGSIGCYVGGCLALAGKPVVFLGRPRMAQALTQHGLTVTDLEGRKRKLEPAAIRATDDHASALKDAALILVCVKSGGTVEMAQSIDQHAPERSTIVSLQNGVENVGRIQTSISNPHPVVSGMVPFNVVIDDEGPVSVHRATDGDVLIDEQMPGLAEALTVAGLPVGTHADMRGVLWGKLLMNLNNALVALSDLPLAQELGDRAWRRLLAQQMDEALAAMSGADIEPARLAGASPSLLPTILRLPNWLFSLIAKRMLAVDPQARSSMWEDLMRGRPTEIDEFQGTVLRLASYSGVNAPLTKRVEAAIRAAEKAGTGPPKMRPEELTV